MECMIEIAGTTSSRELQRFIAMTICRLAQNCKNFKVEFVSLIFFLIPAALIPKITELKNFFSGMMCLCKNPNGTIWRQASRTLALCIVHGKGEDILMPALPFIEKLALADQAEFQVDALRALDKISSSSVCLVLTEDSFWEKLFQIAKEATVPCIIQLCVEILLNICRSGGLDSIRSENSVCVVQSLLTKSLPLCERQLKQLLDLLTNP